jgi:phosphate transport system protein
MRRVFSENLSELQDETLAMGSMVEEAIRCSVDSLKNRNMKEAQKVIDDDSLIDKKQYEIEDRCTTLLATQQPMASDLRVLIAILNIASELERIGDHAEGIARITLMLADEPPVKPLIDIPRMAEKAQGMLRRSLISLAERDADSAVSIAAEDDEVDNLYDQVYRELLVIMLSDPRTIQRATRLLWAAHNLERIADRVTNICERVVYTIKGEIGRMRVSGY